MKVGFIKKFKRTKTTPDIFGAECYLHGKTKTILLQIVPQIKEEFLFTGGPQRQKICIKNAT